MISTPQSLCVVNSIIPVSCTPGGPWQMTAVDPLLCFRVMLDCQLKTELALLALAIWQMAAGIIQHSHAINCVKQLWHRPCLSCFRATCDLRITGKPFLILRLVWPSHGGSPWGWVNHFECWAAPCAGSAWLTPHGGCRRGVGIGSSCAVFLFNTHKSCLLGYVG